MRAPAVISSRSDAGTAVSAIGPRSRSNMNGTPGKTVAPLTRASSKNWAGLNDGRSAAAVPGSRAERRCCRWHRHGRAESPPCSCLAARSSCRPRCSGRRSISARSPASVAFGRSVDPDVSLITTDCPYGVGRPAAQPENGEPAINLARVGRIERQRSIRHDGDRIGSVDDRQASASVASPSGRSVAPACMQATTSGKNTG